MEIYPGDKFTRTVKVLWPDGPRWVDENTIKTWAYDAWYDHADYYRCNRCGKDILEKVDDCVHDADCTPIYTDNTPCPLSLEDCMAFLEDIGLVTFGKQ